MEISEDILFDIVKYIYEKNGRAINFSNFDSFFQNGISFPEFICIICKVSEIPKVSKKVISMNQKALNNENAIEFLKRISPKLENINSFYIKSKWYSSIIIQILMNFYFKKITLKYIISKSNALFQTIGFNIHKENEIFTGIYFIRLLHILTDHEVQLIDAFNNSADVNRILKPIFSKYKIIFILNSQSFDYDKRVYAFFQIQIIFDEYQEKIKSLIHDEEETEEEEIRCHIKYDSPSHIKILTKNIEENIFLRLVNIIGKDLGFKFFNFEEIIEEGFIPKYLMRVLHIDSIENVSDVNANSMDLQIKNIKAVINFLRKDNPSIEYHLFDFQTPSKRSYSTRLLLRWIMNLYFIKSTREEMDSRYYILTESFKVKDHKCLHDIFKRPKTIYDKETMMKLVKFIVQNKNIMYRIKIKKYDIPYILKSSYFEIVEKYPDLKDYFYYQLQIFYDLIDKRCKSLHLIEKLKNALYKINRIKMPTFSTIKSAIKAKNVHLENKQQNQEIIDENEIEETIEVSIKMNDHPTMFKDRFKKDFCKDKKEVNHSQIENPHLFWNPKNLLNNAHFNNGILTSVNQKSDNKVSLDLWNDNITIIQKEANKQNLW